MEDIDRLVQIVARLRAKDGCPWDKVQTQDSIKHCLVEECGEFLDALEDRDDTGMQEELGDLLLQVVFHAQIAREQGRFSFEDIVVQECDKLVRRHPHVFGDVHAENPADALRSWEASKAKEADKIRSRPSGIDGVPRSMPGLARAQKTLQKAAKHGFEWAALKDVVEKVEEEFQEVKDAVSRKDEAGIREELGDLLFTVVSLCRWHHVEAEEALHASVKKFISRYKSVERQAREQDRPMEKMSAAELLELWRLAKVEERQPAR